MIIFEGEHGCVDYDILDTTKDGTRKIIVRGRGVINLSDQMAGSVVCQNLIKREAYIKLKKLVDELEEDLK